MRVTKKIKAEQLRILEETYRGAKPELHFRHPFELLIAVMLSAQCTDKRVNVVTEKLFQEADTPEAIMGLGIVRLDELIKAVFDEAFQVGATAGCNDRQAAERVRLNVDDLTL